MKSATFYQCPTKLRFPENTERFYSTMSNTKAHKRQVFNEINVFKILPILTGGGLSTDLISK